MNLRELHFAKRVTSKRDEARSELTWSELTWSELTIDAALVNIDLVDPDPVKNAAKLVSTALIKLASFSQQNRQEVLYCRDENGKKKYITIAVNLNDCDDSLRLNALVEGFLAERVESAVPKYDYPLIIGDNTDIDSPHVNLVQTATGLCIRYCNDDFFSDGMAVFLYEIANHRVNKRGHDADAMQERLFIPPVCESNETLIDHFVRIADEAPQKIAFIDDDQALSYAELTQRVIQVAAGLQSSMLVAQGDKVAVLLPRSVNSLISMLAIAYCGGIYIPIDIKYPSEHIEYSVSLTQPKVLITTRANQSALFDESAGRDTHGACIENSTCIEDLLLSEEKCAVLKPAHANDVFAILFTSGTTGRAKAVVHNQASFIGRFHWLWQVAPFKPGDIVAQRTTIGFGPHIWEFWGALLQGETTVILRDETIADPFSLAAMVEKYGITRLSMVPSLAKQIVEYPELAEKFTSLTLCSIAGEAISPDFLVTLKAYFSSTHFYNDFGSTEANCLFFQFLEDNGAPSLALGKPSSAAKIRVLDGGGQKVLPYCAGNLHVGGPTLAAGYIHPDVGFEPLDLNAEGLMNTGDVVYYRPSGELISLGRQDSLVKIRGMRVDLKSVKQQLRQALFVDDLEIIVQSKKNDENQLIAFYIDSSKNNLELLRLARERLPEHVCPAYFYYIERYPLLGNGKINQRKLISALSQKKANTNNGTLATLHNIICELTELPHHFSTIQDASLSELGINSLLLVTLLAEINTTFSLSLSVDTLLRVDSVRSLGQLVTHGGFDNLVSEQVKSLLDDDLSQLCASIKQPQHSAKEGSGILLTGATGFLGAFMLEQLLRNSHRIIYCPVRASSDLNAGLKLKKNLASYGLDHVVNDERIHVFAAFLDQDNMGLTQEHFNTISLSTSEIIHAASQVNHLADYKTLRHRNNAMMKSIIDLMAYSKVDTFHLVSSIAVNRFNHDIWREESLHLEGEKLSSGYGQCKWISEQLLSHYQKTCGLNLHIYRVAEIGGSCKSGRGRTDDIVHNLLAIMNAVGNYPDCDTIGDLVLDMLPVDWVCQFITTQKSCSPSHPNIYHLSNETIALSDVFDAFGLVAVEADQLSAWLHNIDKIANDCREKLINGLSLFTSSCSDTPLLLEYFLPLGLETHCMRQHILDANMPAPDLSASLLNKYQYYLNALLLTDGENKQEENKDSIRIRNEKFNEFA